jgi:PRTRC genetic system protein B
MHNITNQFEDIYLPYKGIVVYKNKRPEIDTVYVESFDFSLTGRPINFHPLTDRECVGFEQSLTPTKGKQGFLHQETMLPKTVLHINPVKNGGATWYSKARKTPLFFKEGLQIPAGVAAVPPLLWKATKEQLHIFALSTTRRPTWETPLYYAPFFNISENGRVCMGSVDINIAENCSLDTFATQWERYFFTSTFTHLLGAACPVKGNVIQLWQKQIKTGEKFPLDVLLKTKYTIKNIIYDNRL